ncbi:MAG: methyltransferase domain-containing protein, partial [Promethearchaeota archaeon]
RKEGLTNQLIFSLKLDILKIFNIFNRLCRKSKMKKYLKSRQGREIKIHFGGGKERLDGFLNTDILGKIPINIAKKLPFPSESIDIIYSCHVVEHLYYKQFKVFIKESYRVLKKGGIHIIMTPSFTRLIDALYYNKDLRIKLLQGHEKFAGIKLSPALLLNYMTHVYYGHKFIHDYESIARPAEFYGYSQIKIISFSEIPDETIRNYAFMRETRGNERWRIETETYLLVK